METFSDTGDLERSNSDEYLVFVEGAEIIKRLFLYLDEWDTFCFELCVICFI